MIKKGCINEEKERIRMAGIYINNAGYYNYSAPIICCPVCGIMLNRYKNMTKSEIEYILDDECVGGYKL